MDRQRPRGREKNVTGPAQKVSKRGEGLNTGPVGVPREQGGGGRSAGARSAGNRAGGGLKMMILLAVLLLGGGGGGLLAMLGGQTQGSQPVQSNVPASVTNLTALLGGGNVSSGWQGEANTGRLDATVARGAREKFTKPLGNERDTVTIMVYMCGTDLESRAGMGTSDLQEMLGASFGSNVNLLVYTGGCKGWKNNQVSSSTNQIWQVKGGELVCLQRDLGAVSMTDPSVLSGYIRWCAQNYPASRYALILWDHGGGSVSGYGYDEKFASTGSMSLAEINTALGGAGVQFDFVGFDACLMATAETALTVARYADYLIASEETEPGVGWYYTDWLTDLGKDTSMPTIELGKKIVDSFVDTCAQKCRGQATTLSVIDLAEAEVTFPDALADFARSTSALIQAKDYQTVATARNGAREFARSSKIDQVDLVHLARNMGTKEGRALAEALLGAVKYNRTSSDMTNAYGVSIYFPYQNKNSVNQAVAAYEALGMDDSYSKCIRDFASVQQAGQVSVGGGGPMDALGWQVISNFGLEQISEYLQMAMRDGLLSDRSMDLEETAQYISDHHLNRENLRWSGQQEDGAPVLHLDEDQWSLVQALDLNLFYDDGEGYIDLGLDNVFAFNDNGDLLGTWDGSWLAINGQVVAYYHTSTVDDGEHYTITGYVPVLHNGQRSELLLTFDDANPYGYVSGIRAVYPDGETETVAKSDIAIQEGDVLEFLCDYYGYGANAGPLEDFRYLDSYRLGEPLTVTALGLTVTDVPLSGTVKATYRFTDLYNIQYWTTPIPG